MWSAISETWEEEGAEVATGKKHRVAEIAMTSEIEEIIKILKGATTPVLTSVSQSASRTKESKKINQSVISKI